MMSIEREVGEIKVMVTNIEDLLKTSNERVSRLERHVNALRRWQSFIIGGCSAISAAAGAIGVKLLHFFAS